MLKQLYIKNFALIDTLDMEFFPGFSVITGETGAGKSIILGAINLLLGQRADSRQIKKGADKCVIEAHFDLSRYDMKAFFDENDIEYDANDTILRRNFWLQERAGHSSTTHRHHSPLRENSANSSSTYTASTKTSC